jgi:pyruvate/2-oxoglutarate dehydrogenase complex dihydrolipoamide dehydrogenase (E3) component
VLVVTKADDYADELASVLPCDPHAAPQICARFDNLDLAALAPELGGIFVVRTLASPSADDRKLNVGINFVPVPGSRQPGWSRTLMLRPGSLKSAIIVCGRRAAFATLARHGAHYGTVTSSVTVDMAIVRQRKREMVERQIAKRLQIYRASGAELIMGSGRFVAPKTLEVKLNDGGTRVLTADKVFLNVGTRAAIPNVPGLEAARPLTHIEALELDYLPQRLIVIGGGYSGLELAQAYRRFGSDVTIIESGPQLLAREDIDVSQEMRRILSGEGIQVLVEAELLQVRGQSGDRVTLGARTPSGEQYIDGSDILVAAGRIPNTTGIGLKEAGVELDGRGYIRVNGRLETSAPDVWAVGECAGSPQFTHISEDDFRIIRDNLAGGNRSTHDRLIPYCMFTDPPLARVGLSEGEAERQGVLTRVARLPMDSVLGAQATDQRRLYEGSCWRQRRSHPWLLNDWCRGR